MVAKGLRSKRGNAAGPTAFSAMLRNPVYAGNIVANRASSAGKHEPLVESDTFRAVEQALALMGRSRPS